MRVLRLVVIVVLLQAVRPAAGAAQGWDAPRTLELVGRATARRALAEADSGLQRWDAVARGMVLFLTQIGGDQVAPKLVKADELAVEVYWEAPGRSKQRIIAWRDRAWLPTDIHYHRDHLGIVANDFGPTIRIGDGDEVRDVPHPLSTGGLAHYQFALVDSVTVTSGGQSWQVYTVRVRPRDTAKAAVLGTLYLDRGSAALVRFQFSFTAAAYREAALEDITVVLENALQSGGHWLPWRQEIEIRRRSGLVDLPVRGIIRGHWQMTDLRLDADVPSRPLSATAGAAIGGLLAPGGPEDGWEGSLEDQVTRAIGPVDRMDFEALRHDLRAGLPASGMQFGPPVRPAFGGLSDLARFNRVEGLRLSLGALVHLPGIPIALAPWAGIGLGNHRLSGRLDVTAGTGARSAVRLRLERRTLDVGQAPIISPIVNSLLAQELGTDRGDWAERLGAELQWTHRGKGGLTTQAGVSVEQWDALPTVATPARGAFRANAALSTPRFAAVRVGMGRPGGGAPYGGGEWHVEAEAGGSGTGYLRLAGRSRWIWQMPPSQLRLSVEGGWGSRGLPAVRGFVLGGWGTLPGTGFRSYGGQRYALGRLEWLGRVGMPKVRLGSFPPVDPELRIGPFVALGVADGVLPAVSWRPSGGIRPVVGITMEGLFGLLRLEVGRGLRQGSFGASLDVSSSWWNIL